MDNPVIEKFNGRLRDEYLDVESFFSVADAQRKTREEGRSTSSALRASEQDAPRGLGRSLVPVSR